MKQRKKKKWEECQSWRVQVGVRETGIERQRERNREAGQRQGDTKWTWSWTWKGKGQGKRTSPAHTYSDMYERWNFFAVTHTQTHTWTHAHSPKHAHQCQRKSWIGNGSWFLGMPRLGCGWLDGWMAGWLLGPLVRCWHQFELFVLAFSCTHSTDLKCYRYLYT